MTHLWTPDRGALKLLESSSSPFNQRGYREAWVRTRLDAVDASFGGLLPDGTRGAIALVRVGRRAFSLPLGYGGPVGERPLSADEIAGLLSTARAASGASAVVSLEVPIGSASDLPDEGRRQVATTHVVDLAADPADGFSKKARQSIRRAMRAGAEAQPGTGDATAFVTLYEAAAQGRGTVYPTPLLADLGRAGPARFYDVAIDGVPVSSVVALVGPEHWMYWAAAQSDAGRHAESGYLALAAMLTDARARSATAVNLGGSASGGDALEGVAQFKRRFGGQEVPVFQRRSATRLFSAAEGAHTRLQALRSRRR